MLLQYITIKFPTNETSRENVRKRSRNGVKQFNLLICYFSGAKTSFDRDDHNEGDIWVTGYGEKETTDTTDSMYSIKKPPAFTGGLN